METLITQGQKKQIGRFLSDAVEDLMEVLSIRKDAAQKVIERGGELQKAVIEATQDKILELQGEVVAISEWIEFYHDYFGLDVNLSDVEIPEHQKGFRRLIVVAKELLTASAGNPYAFVLEAMRKHFPVLTPPGELDNMMIANDRWPNASYAVFFRDCVEADEELRNLSSEDLEKRKISGITCLERLLYELKYFAETKKHLDTRSWTLCSGSYDSANGVPDINFDNGKVSISWSRQLTRAYALRTRAIAVNP